MFKNCTVKIFQVSNVIIHNNIVNIFKYIAFYYKILKSILCLGRKQPNPSQKKNIAKERMRILRKSLSLDKEKLKEIGRAIINEKSSQKLSKSLPNSHSK